VRLLSVYSSPHRMVEYADGHCYPIVALNVEVEPIGGTLMLSDETIDWLLLVGREHTHIRHGDACGTALGWVLRATYARGAMRRAGVQARNPFQPTPHNCTMVRVSGAG
jgi:hypothetical protein